MILKVHVDGALAYAIGEEIWQGSLTDAITAEAEMIADYAGADLLGRPGQRQRDTLRSRIVAEMTRALVSADDQYQAPDGVLYSLIDGPDIDLPGGGDTLSRMTPRASDPGGGDTLSRMTPRASDPIVEEVLRFEDLPHGSYGTRRAIVRWSDGTEGAALTWYADEILVCEGDLIGKSQAELRSLQFGRDRDWMQS